MSATPADWPFPAPDQEEEEPKRFYGVATATVLDPLDPMFLGRLQVLIHFIDSLDLSAWARVAVPMAGQFSGFYCLPKPGDEVLVAFEHGDVNVPYIIGSLWNALSPPPLLSPIPQIRAIRSPLGNQLVFTEAPPTLILQNGPTPPDVIPSPPVPAAYQSIALAPTGVLVAATTVTVMCGANLVTINPTGVSIASGTTMSLTAATAITITAGTNVSITAGAAVTITGALVAINP
jgi:phage baseplate assembly protein gpV